MLSKTYAHVRARLVISVVILGQVVPLVFWWLLPGAHISDLEERSVGLVVLEIISSCGLPCLLIWYFWGRNRSIKEIFGQWPNRREMWTYLTLAIPMVGINFVGMYLLFWPLSYIAPKFVSWWLLDKSTPDLIWVPSLEAICVNSLVVLRIALLVPIVEEIVFRGFILHRWRERYGEKGGIVMSSVLFGILHPEILGTIVGAMIVSVLCLRTKSLVGPILVHIGNNLGIMLYILVYGFIGGDVEGMWDASTIEEFRSEWWLAPIGAVIGIPWLLWFVRTRLSGVNGS